MCSSMEKSSAFDLVGVHERKFCVSKINTEFSSYIVNHVFPSY
jgi:hypothetical protein